MTVFLRILDEAVEQKAAALLDAAVHGGTRAFGVEPNAFGSIPGSPFAYWVSQRIRKVFDREPRFESNGRLAKGGMKTQADERFLRLQWELREDSDGWRPLCKGGAFGRFYADVHLVTDWWSNGKRPRAAYEYKAAGESWGGFGRNENFYFRPGLTWPRRTNGLSFRVMPKGCIFGDKGPAAFVESDDPAVLLSLCAIMNSRPFGYLLGVQLARTELAQSYEVGLIQQTPVPDLNRADRRTLATLARRAWMLTRRLDASVESSHAFVLPASILRREAGFDFVAMETDLVRIQREIDDMALDLYGIEGEDQIAIETWGRGVLTENPSGTEGDIELDEVADKESDVLADDANGLLSWAVGVAFGRFDIRLATGERALPPEPAPFELLPAKSPGMVPDGDPPFMPCQGVLVDDLGHGDDLTARVTAVYERVGGSAEEPDPRRRLAQEFFPAHIKRYSRSRRKAPIYWQLATPSSRYSVWLYIHAFTRDTLFRVQTDYGAAKLIHEQRQLAGLRAEAGPNPSGAQRKLIETQEVFVDELQAFVDEVKRVAPLWNPELDDGVIINFAPLWRLVPQCRAWQRELRATWEALANGDYNWAHLAMHLWPERVVPKCATDRSLAIAHGLEDTFWFEDENGKWKALDTPARPIEKLAAERTSPAVKAALKSLVEAPDPTGTARRSRNGKGR